jgi:biotin carboxyl carrier protein
MPGTISKILVKEGQSVKKGEVLAILEAMKMENEIVSPKDGVVSSIDVSQGQNVNLNDSILKID